MDDNNKAQRIMFARVIYDTKPNKRPINVNTVVYSLPKQTTASSLILTSEKDDENSYEQIESTLRALTESNIIYTIVHKFISKNSTEKSPITHIVLSIENYIMPSFGGRTSLSNVSGLITLQAFVRERMIRYANHFGYKLRMTTPSPTTVKKLFALDGKAEKKDMMRSFIERYKGQMLIPVASEKSVNDLNDVVDAFAMCVYAYSKIMKNDNLLNNDII